ncbi:MAG: PTS sugar transporter subunit IIA [Burkholderiales bacterium]|nr:PTS sugar transporter subunit IIA [Burkholderiales bacterium]
MVGILIVAHGALAESLIRSAAHVLGRVISDAVPLGVAASDDPEALLPRASALVSQLDDGSGVLVLTDMVGGTPANIATRLATPGRIEVIAGANLPMLMRALTYREEPLARVVEKAMSGGHEGVVHIQPEPMHAARRG